MAKLSLSASTIQRSLDAYTQHGGNMAAASASLKIPRPTLQHHIAAAKRLGMTSSVGMDSESHLKLQIKRLESELKSVQAETLDASLIKARIIGLTDNVSQLQTPSWLVKEKKGDASFGVPTLFLSDLHAGEVVDPKQINGVNEYNLKIFHERIDALAESSIRLLNILSPKMDYPGIVIPLGGDNCSGNIHDELTATNEFNSMPIVLDLFETLGSFISTMADKFHKVFLPCVTGNHGRDTRKIWGKDRHHTSFDWLLYCFLAKHFANDERITFFIPDGPDAYYKVYEHRYNLTHGDQFRGGDGVIGPLGPIIRGDHRKRSRNAQIDMEYDTLIMGHWHQWIQLRRLIVNGSLKGYDEYAYANNFPFEVPQQGLWITHPRYRITYSMPVYVDRARIPAKTNWVSVAA